MAAYNIHQAAEKFGISTHTLRYYDNAGLFPDMQRDKNGARIFTDEQMDWLRLIKDHIAVSLSIEPDDLDLNPFDRKGGLGRFYEVFGDSYEAILTEMNIELVA